MFDFDVVGYADVEDDGLPNEVQIGRLDVCVWYVRKERVADVVRQLEERIRRLEDRAKYERGELVYGPGQGPLVKGVI